MFGIGPEWVHTRQYGVTTNSVAAEAALDFMFWPSGNIDSAGSSNRATSITLGEGMSDHLAKAVVC